MQERFILMPDRENGRLTSYVNRNLFFGDEDKINKRLPAVIAEFQERLLQTVKKTLTILGEVQDKCKKLS